MSLKPQDVVVLLKLSLLKGDRPAYSALALELGMSPSEVHAAVKRAIHAGLIGANGRPNRSALMEFLVHGVKYAFAPERGGLTRGMPTAHGAPPLSDTISSSDYPPLW